MAPIRTAIIGLSESAVTSWASAAHLPYLLSPRGRERFKIVALCNSSVASAHKAIAHFQLPDSEQIRAYGDPTDLARDPDVDLVVCNTRVDVHHGTVRPSVEAGKAVFCEWPLAQDVHHARDLVELAREKDVKTVMGLQGRLSPMVEKLRSLLREGRIGKVLSVEVRAFGGLNARDTVPTDLSYFLDRKNGGNIFTIGFGHLFDTVQSVVGNIDGLKGHLQIQRPELKVFDKATKSIVGTERSNVPDLIIATGSLAGSPLSQDKASIMLRFRLGQPWPEEPPLVWTINGEKGELRLTSWASTSLSIAFPHLPVVIDVHDYESDTVERVEWKWEAWQEDLPVPARNIGLVYEAYATGDDQAWPHFQDALATHKQLEDLLAEFPPY
ncbi:NAD(P)-binding protein [Decorospora gaudefroyi]|uniref:NAD(P)-binding protein n=1 Tax=Decorospora gaudefroyi TaxID=184978 RepID=A0A6A5K3Q8_9PLEO|nr:NAD(P)-binding protein [Decorospora gaudefroyi]